MRALLFIMFVTLVNPTDKESRNKIASDIVTNLSKGAYEEVRKDFSGSLKSNLTKEKLAEVWEAVVAQIGDFKEVVNTTHDIFQGYNIIRKRCKFEKDNATIEMSFNEEEKVIGLWIKP